MTALERTIVEQAPGPPSGVSLEQADARRRHARTGVLRLGWSLVGAGVLLVSLAVAPGVEGAAGGALGLLMLGVRVGRRSSFCCSRRSERGRIRARPHPRGGDKSRFRVRRRADGARARGFRCGIVIARARRISTSSRARRSRAWRRETGRGGGRVVGLGNAAHSA